MGIRVCRAEVDDVPHVVAIWEEFMELLRQTNPDYWKVVNGPVAFSRYLTGILEDSDFLLAVAREKKGDPAGFVLAYNETLPEWFGSERVGLIRYMAVSGNSQGRGAGREMVAFVMDWFRSLGIRRVELYVLKGLSASGYWEKIGFKPFMERRFLEI